MVTKKKLEADLAAANEALEAEKQKSAAAAKAHDDKVKELSGKVKELEATVRKEIDAAVEQAKADPLPPPAELTRDIFSGPWQGERPRMCNIPL